MTARETQDPLLTDKSGRPIGPGPVYQGVAKQIRAMIDAGQLDRALDAGLIASTRQLARSVDRASGHGGYRVEYGQSLAAMHQQLMVQLKALGGQVDPDDPFAQLMRDLSRPEPAAPDAG